MPDDEEEDEIAALASLVTVALKAKGAKLERLALSIGKPSAQRSPRRLLDDGAAGLG